jgi:plastocyanin domain-containing protein
MFSISKILGSVTSLGLMLGIASGVTAAEMPASTATQTNQFRRIEQPLGLKVGVTVAGLGLIGLEFWWFLLSKTKSQSAQTQQGTQEITITVDGGYEPDHVLVKSGQPVCLNFLRRDASSCLEQVLLPDFHIAKDLELNQVTPIEFTPDKPGQYLFTCGMNMFRGVVEVEQ